MKNVDLAWVDSGSEPLTTVSYWRAMGALPSIVLFTYLSQRAPEKVAAEKIAAILLETICTGNELDKSNALGKRDDSGRIRHH